MKRALFLVIMLCISIVSHGQLAIVKQSITSSNSKVRMFYFDTIRNAPKLVDSLSLIKRCFNLSENDKLVHKSKVVDAAGIVHTRFQQFHSGIKVENAEIIVNSKNGNILSINGEAGIIGKINLTPELKSEEAIEYAKESLKAKVFAWESPQMETLLKKARKDEKATYKPKPELVLWGNNDTIGYCLSYKISIAVYDPNGSYVFYIHAQTGEILEVLDKNFTAVAVTRYSGTVNIDTRFNPDSGKYFLQDFNYAMGRFIETKDCNNSLPANSVPFSDLDDTWDEWHNAEMDDGALDAHLGARKSYDYFKYKHNRNSYDNAYGDVLVFVHYFNPQMGLGNAKWDPDIHAICCADGDSVDNYQPFTSEEIIGHEFGHGVLLSYTNVNYSGETGALDEGLADIWGACIEEYANLPGNNMWISMEDVIATPSLRKNFAEPSQSLYKYTNVYGQQLERYPDTYLGNGWYTGGISDTYVHANSAVISHWFHILSTGGIDTNDNQYQYVVSPIGTEIASNIIYATLSRFTYNTNFSTFKQFTIDAAEALYGGINSNVDIQVKNAWYAVGIGNEVPAIISGNNMCTLGTDYTFSLPEEFEGETITWSITGYPYIVSGQGTKSVILRSYNTGPATISATYNHGNGNIVAQLSIWVGLPSIDYISGPAEGSIHETLQYFANGYQFGTDFNWSISPVYEENNLFTNGSSVEITFDSFYDEDYLIICTPENVCGSGSPAYKETHIYGYYFMVYPNPASDEVTLEINETTSLSAVKSTGVTRNGITNIDTREKVAYTVRIYNSQGILVTKLTRSGKSFKVPINNLRDGNYIIELNDGKKSYREQLIVKH